MTETIRTTGSPAPGWFKAESALGRSSHADNDAIVAHLLNTHGIFAVRREGLVGGECVRITPAQFTMADHVDRLTHAVRDAARQFRA